MDDAVRHEDDRREGVELGEPVLVVVRASRPDDRRGQRPALRHHRAAIADREAEDLAFEHVDPDVLGLGALVLAMLSDSIAFLSNTSSEIEAIIHFGIAAGIAAASSFLVLGVIVPLAAMRIDELRRPQPASASLVARIITLTSSASLTALTGASVLLLVVGLTIPGVVILLATIVGFLVIPTMIMRRRNRGLELQDDSFTSPIDAQREEAKTSWLVDRKSTRLNSSH